MRECQASTCSRIACEAGLPGSRRDSVKAMPAARALVRSASEVRNARERFVVADTERSLTVVSAPAALSVSVKKFPAGHAENADFEVVVGQVEATSGEAAMSEQGCRKLFFC